jgi:hypothetical protein
VSTEDIIIKEEEFVCTDKFNDMSLQQGDAEIVCDSGDSGVSGPVSAVVAYMQCVGAVDGISDVFGDSKQVVINMDHSLFRRSLINLHLKYCDQYKRYFLSRPPFFGYEKWYRGYVEYLASVPDSVYRVLCDRHGDLLRGGYCYLQLFVRREWPRVLMAVRSPRLTRDTALKLTQYSWSLTSDVWFDPVNCHVTPGGSSKPGLFAERISSPYVLESIAIASPIMPIYKMFIGFSCGVLRNCIVLFTVALIWLLFGFCLYYLYFTCEMTTPEPCYMPFYRRLKGIIS